jgi:ubiquitin-protein ligase E3 C
VRVPAPAHALYAVCAQTLISGANTSMSLADLKAHCEYAGGYTSVAPTVAKFWRVVETLTPEDHAALLRFVTACERPPPLGFADLHPRFCIQRVEGGDDRLPTASTCFNALKLPPYSSEKVLKARLLASIHSGAGFDLS